MESELVSVVSAIESYLTLLELIPAGTPASFWFFLVEASFPPPSLIRVIRCCVSHGLHFQILRELIAESTRERERESTVPPRCRYGEEREDMCILRHARIREYVRKAALSFPDELRKRRRKNATRRPDPDPDFYSVLAAFRGTEG